MKKTTIGLFGFGVVGEGIYKVLTQKPQLQATIKKVVIKQIDKTRDAPTSLFSVEADDILKDKDIDLVVELIDDAAAAYDIVTAAIKSGKSVVTANKKLIAEHHLELIALSRKHDVSLLYEAAVCGSVPIIRNLEEYFDNDLLSSVKGIVNGSTNFILSKMLHDGQSYVKALDVAQEKGFAESDPSLDVEGVDAAYKLSIIALHAFGKSIFYEDIIRKGITSLDSFDFQYAQEKKWVIKLIAKAVSDGEGGLLDLSVLPTFVPERQSLALTENEFNGILVGSTLADEQFFYGKGAGRYPTSSAVLSDISAIKYGYKYEYKKGQVSDTLSYSDTSKFYISYDRETKFDQALFEKIDEHFVGENRVYLIGDIYHKNLRGADVLSKSDISIIALN